MAAADCGERVMRGGGERVRGSFGFGGEPIGGVEGEFVRDWIGAS